MGNILIRAIELKEKVEMIYSDKNNQVSQRIIHPVKKNNDLVVAYCYTKRTIRTFRLDNILSVDKVRHKVGA